VSDRVSRWRGRSLLTFYWALAVVAPPDVAVERDSFLELRGGSDTDWAAGADQCRYVGHMLFGRAGEHASDLELVHPQHFANADVAEPAGPHTKTRIGRSCMA
jgi:hypothetical protein